MKLLTTFIFVGLLFMLVGCNSANVAQNSLLIRSGSNLATATALLTVKPEDRVNAAREIYDIAAAVNKASADQTDLSGVDTIAEEYLSKWDSPYKVVVGALFKTIEQYIQDYLQNNYASATADDRVKALRAFLLAASAGVQDGSLPYAQGLPAMRYAVRKSGLKGIVVESHDWVKPPSKK